MKTNEERKEAIKDNMTKDKEIIFCPDTLVCMAYLDELRKQQVSNKKVYQRLVDDTVRKLA